MAFKTKRMTSTVTFKVYPKQKRLLNEIAERAGRSQSDLLRTCLREFLSENSEDEHSSSPGEDRHSSSSRPGKVREGPGPFTKRLERVLKG